MQPEIGSVLQDGHYRSIAALIEERVGIQLPAVKRTMVEGRLRKRVRALDLDGLDAYGRLLFEEGFLSQELTHLIDCVTTNKTDFFREPSHFDFLRDEATPALDRTEPRLGFQMRVAVNSLSILVIALILWIF